MLKLVKSEIRPTLEQSVIRMAKDVIKLQHLTAAEVRAVYGDLLVIRNALTELLAKVDASR